ncbi:MAG: ABC transporter substrate-binding protein [Bacillota bacterium]
MPKRFSPGKAIFFVLFLPLVMFSVLGQLTKSSRETHDTSILIAAPVLPGTCDPVSVPDPKTGGFLPNVYEGLVRFKPGSCEVEPCLATDWELSADGCTWTFQLRRDVRFHTGQKLTAELVKTCFADKLEAASRLPHLRPLFGMVEDVFAPDRTRVCFKLKYPYAPFLRNLALPQAAICLPGRPSSGTGPYRIISIKKGTITLMSYAGYRSRIPPVTKVTVQSVPDPSDRINLLKKKAGVIAVDIPPDFIADLPPGKLTKTTGISVSYIGFYTNKRPFDNPTARYAVALAVDRIRLCSSLYGNLLPPATGLIPPAVLDTGCHSPIPQPDPLKARELFKSLGLEDITLLTYEGTRPYNPAGGIRLAQEIKDHLEAAGLRVSIRGYPWQELKEAISQQKGDTFLYGWLSDNGDPDNCLSYPLAGPQIAQGYNTTHYRNPVLDLLLARAQQVPSFQVRRGIYERALKIVSRDNPVIPLNYGSQTAACTPDITGFTLHPAGTYDLSKVTLAKH